MVEKMTAVSPNKEEAQFHYLPVDITLMADVKRFTNECIFYPYNLLFFPLINLLDMQLNERGLNTLCMVLLFAIVFFLT